MRPSLRQESSEEAIIAQVMEPVRRFLLRVLRHQHDAEDAASLTLLKLMQVLRGGSQLKAPVAYALRVAWSRAVKLRQGTRALATSGVPETQDPRTGIDRTSEMQEWIGAAFNSLDEDARAILHLRHVEDLSYDAIATVLDIPLGTVKSRLHLARDAFRRGLARGDGGGVAPVALLVLPTLSGKAAPGWAVAAATALARGDLAAGARITRMVGLQKAAAVAAAAILVVVTMWWRPWEVPTGSGRDDPSPTNVARAAEEPGGTSAPQPVMPRPFAGDPASDEVAAIQGTVTDPAGRPVSSARVLIYPDTLAGFITGDAAVPPGEGVASTTTDESGQFNTHPRRPNAYYAIVVQHAGFAPKSTQFVRAGTAVRIEMRPAATIQGTVTDIAGAAIAGARLRWTGLLDKVRLVRESTSGADGTFRVEEVVPIAPENGDCGPRALLEVEAPGYTAALLSALPAMDAAQTIRCNVRLEAACVVSGTVRRSITGAPIPQATLEGWSTGVAKPLEQADGGSVSHPFRPWTFGQTRTDDAGRYALPGVPRALHEPEALRAAVRQLLPSAYLAVHLPAGGALVRACSANEERSAAVLDFVVPAFGKLHGFVRDDAGTPLEGVEVRLIGGAPEPFVDPWSIPVLAPERVRAAYTARTIADGSYAFDAVPVADQGSTICRVAAVPPGYRFGMDSAEATVQAAAGDVALVPPLVIPRSPAAIIAVKDSTGRPVWGADVSVSAELLDAPASAHNGSVRSDSAGRARLIFPRAGRGDGYLPQPPSTYRFPLHAAAPTMGPERGYVRARGFAFLMTPAFIPSIDQPPVIEVTLQPESVLTGAVHYDDGSPVRGANIVVSDPDFDLGQSKSFPDTIEREKSRGHLLQYGWCYTGADGSFRVARLPPGPYRIVAVDWPNDKVVKSTPITVPDASQPVSIVMPPMPDRYPQGTVVVEAHDAATHQLVPQALPAVIDVPPFCASVPVAPGRWRFTRLPLGSWRIRVTARGYRPVTSGPITVGRDREELRQNIDLDRGATIAGFVELERETIRPMAQLRLTDAATGAVQLAAIDPDGHFELSGLEPEGRYLVRADNRSTPGGPATVWTMPRNELLSVPADRSHPLRLALVPAQELRLEIHGTMLVFRNYESPTSPGQRERAAKAQLTLRSADGTFVWQRRPIDAKVTDFALLPGEYLTRLDLDGETVEERTLTITLSEPCRVTLEAGDSGER